MGVLQDEDGISLTSDESTGVYTLRMDRGPNVVNPRFVDLLGKAIGKIEKAPHPKALVVTGTGKFFSNGLDLEYLQRSSESQKGALITSFWELLARLMVADCRTVASINGHGFGAGLFLALACDYRVMRTDRGYLCWPEVNLGMRLAKGFSELSKAKIGPRVLRDGVLTAKRYGSKEALASGLIDEECSLEHLRRTSERLAAAGLPENLGLLNFNPRTFRSIKIELYVDAYRALTSGQFDAPPESRL
ncbi:unnamed protein product [Pseudo-nitzschia multistriata]|uniref:Enoyl-CoA hydratase/isomerase family protein n=1 Tax=Pseudo-nitzschia multistriata TaxID=183589 RepID=A0A448Z5S1_9STRA|nr:unnamed protein product [Pseudo-nitzschia multistriata]